MLYASTADGARPPAPDTSQQQPVTELIPINSLVASDSPRTAGESAAHAEMLAEVQTPLPPIVVHRPTMRIVDGMHRVQAAVLRGEDYVRVQFVDGTADDAFVLAVRLNAEHGMPLSRRDRVAAAERIIGSHGQWSDRRIAEVTGLSPVTISALRKRTTADTDQVKVRTGRDGRSKPVNSEVGRRRAVQVIAARPDASLREIAQEAGIAPATARDVRQRIREGKDPVPAKLRNAAQAGGEAGGRRGREKVVAETAGRGARVESVVVAGPDQFASLRKDPSLRFSESGRALLQLLAANGIDDARWRWMMSGVPAHRYADIARAARICGEHWLNFAEQLERGSGMRARRAV
ncbi:MAG TPA: ParB N-terminal domain-containing protein [Kitasatospora aureofaciens]|uniref:ParB/RepB/Spo0J family partition protein n=1 Tax=Kitasatospora aureofaciens TaxID=1894 RepID=UPI001D3657FA|nr:ParB N-terminal domain-containing protein [Kitasatospora aureofaciens]HJD83528.1 ParB N-terminal domain-containing protein [Kitasatospora aureofaciens]